MLSFVEGIHRRVPFWDDEMVVVGSWIFGVGVRSMLYYLWRFSVVLREEEVLFTPIIFGSSKKIEYHRKSEA